MIKGNSLDYKHATMGFAIPEFALLLAYSVPTVGSFLVSTRAIVRTIGVAFFVSLVLAILIKREALTSVWCFFAAGVERDDFRGGGENGWRESDGNGELTAELSEASNVNCF